MADVIDAVGGVIAASRIVGVSYEQVSKWRHNRAKAPFSAMAALAEAAGMSLDWLAYGRDPAAAPPQSQAQAASPAEPPAGAVSPAGHAAPPALDAELTGLITEGISTVYKEAGAALPPRELGRLIARLHADVQAAVEGDDDPGARRGALRALLIQLRRDLHSQDAATRSKRPASA